MLAALTGQVLDHQTCRRVQGRQIVVYTSAFCTGWLRGRADMNDGTTVRRATAGCASKRCRSQAARRAAVRPLIDPRWRNPHIYRSASAKAARSSHPVPMSGTLADVGYGGEAPLMGGGVGGGREGKRGCTRHTRRPPRARAPEIFIYCLREPACASHTIIIFEMQHMYAQSTLYSGQSPHQLIHT